MAWTLILVTFFDWHEFHPTYLGVTLDSTLTYREHYLGVTLDSTLTYREHLTKTAGKLENRNNLLMKLAGFT